MNFIFFQNCLSPHQIPYIKEVCLDERVDKVYLITPRIDYEDRMVMGWSGIDYLKNAQIIFSLNPSIDYIDNLLNMSDCICIFSGIHADKDVFKWFQRSLSFNVKRNIITEFPNIYNRPLWLHRLRFLVQDYRYIKYFDSVLAIGKRTCDYYKSWGKKWNVIPFIYCTDSPVYHRNEYNDINKLSMVFVGSLSKRKNSIIIFRALHNLHSKIKNISIDIIGDGKERNTIEKYVNDHQLNDCVHIVGYMPMDKIQKQLGLYDVLILPSKYDGWGAVVNEAITQGVYVVCSNHCGAEMILKNKKIGSVFKSNDPEKLSNLLNDIYNNRLQIKEDKQYRINWGKCIGGKIIAKYFVDSLTQNTKILPPWNL